MLLFSCKGDAQKGKNIIKETSIKNEQTKKNSIINFFDKRYFGGYELAIDESTISDHPFFRYLACKDLGYFSVHFIPKEKKTLNFWMNDYYKNIDFNNYNFGKDKNKISTLIKSNLDKYYIFSYFVSPEYLNSNGECTIENVFLKENSKAEIYLYDNNLNKWNYLRRINAVTILPPYADYEFFKANFPNLFKDEAGSSISNWYGKYSLTLNENSEDWRNIHEIKLSISENSITYSAEGFQLYEFYKLSSKENNNNLQLDFSEALDNTENEMHLKKTKDFGVIFFDGKKYKWLCPYINENFSEGKEKTYILKKEK